MNLIQRIIKKIHDKDPKRWDGVGRAEVLSELEKYERDNENTESPVREKKQSYTPTICVDFDGVIHKYSKGWHDGSIYDEPIEGAISSMAKLQRKGFRVAIFTARREYLEIGLWLKKHDVNKELNFNELIITSTKLPAVAYIDDRAIRFVNWTEALNYF